MGADDELRIVDVPEMRRFEARLGAAVVAYAEYRLSAGRIIFIHTVVSPDHEGRGFGGRLARGALDEARARGLRVTPRCPFIAAYIERHPEYADLVGPPPASPPDGTPDS
jgi:predicted GNAT family acetyltransferase